jgi:7-cyano-7-deazaguanine synthase
LYVTGGLRWEVVEQRWLQRFVEACALPGLRAPVVLSVPVGDLYGAHWSLDGVGVPDYDAPDVSVYLPGRNVLLLTKGAVYCALQNIRRLALGILRGNPFPDATPEFIWAMGRALSLGLGYPLSVETPFADRTKASVLVEAVALPMHLSFSCANPRGDQHCGNCNKCRERHDAFQAAGCIDRTDYARPLPPTS